MDIEKYKPTKIVKIYTDDLTVPIETGTELSRLALIGKEILLELLKDCERDKETGKFNLNPETLKWYKEVVSINKEIHGLTKGVQERVMLEGYKASAEIYKALAKNLSDSDSIKLIRELEKNAKQHSKKS